MAGEKSYRSVCKVGIIGAGVSGIAAAKQLSIYKPVVLEATNSIGGVWKHCSFNSTRLQTPQCDYEFSDYPWPKRDNSSFPSHVEIVDYLYSYARHFDVLKYVKFNSVVVEIRFLGDHDQETGTTTLLSNPEEQYYDALLTGGKPSWEVAVQTNEHDDDDDDQRNTVQWYEFEFLVVCIGRYGDIPKIPVFPRQKGPEIFNGTVLHSLDYAKLDKESANKLLRGKKVVVIGYRKSAIDLAVECAEANQGEEGRPCTMVIRTLHWTVPSYWIWGLPFFLFYATRSAQFLHERPNQSFTKALLCLFFSPLRRMVSKLIESYLEWKLPLRRYGLRPEHPFEEDYASCQMAILPHNFFTEADKGRIVFKRASKWWFWSDGIQFEDNTKLEADVVILATGFDGKKKLKALLPQPFLDLMEDSSGIMPLYRGTIHPLIPHMAFVGYIESVSNLHSSELKCKWLARLLDGKFKLPRVQKMLEQTQEEMEIMKRSTRFYKRQCISTFSINHSDEICEEMGWRPWRKTNWFYEAFSPYNNQDYCQEY